MSKSAVTSSRPGASPRRKPKPASRKPSPIAAMVIDDAIPALVEMSGGPVEPSRAALASLFGSIDWRAVGHETTSAIFGSVVDALDRAGAEKALGSLGYALASAWKQYRAAAGEQALADALSVFLSPAANPRDVIALCRAGLRRTGGAS